LVALLSILYSAYAYNGDAENAGQDIAGQHNGEQKMQGLDNEWQ